MRILLPILLSFCSLLHGDVLEEMLQRIEQEHQSEEPDLEYIIENVGALQDAITHRTYPLHRKLGWWNEPEKDLLAELEAIADILTPYEEMLIDLAHYEGIQQGNASTLTLLLNARPTETLKAALENYLFRDYSRGVPERSLFVLYELNLADDLLWERLFREILEEERSGDQNFLTLRMLASRNDPVPGFADALLDMIQKDIDSMSQDDPQYGIKLGVSVEAYMHMIDGMGIAMLPVAIKLEKLVLQLMNSPNRDEVLAMYPYFQEQFSSIMRRIRDDVRIEFLHTATAWLSGKKKFLRRYPNPKLLKKRRNRNQPSKKPLSLRLQRNRLKNLFDGGSGSSV